MVYFETEVGKMGGKVTDWTIDDDGLSHIIKQKVKEEVL